MFWSNAWERRLFHFIQKAEVKAHQPPGGVFVPECQPDFIFIPSLLEPGLSSPKRPTGRSTSVLGEKEYPRLLSVQTAF